jgi:hypothetical protein
MKIKCTKCMEEIPSMKSHERGEWWIEPHLCRDDNKTIVKNCPTGNHVFKQIAAHSVMCKNCMVIFPLR